MTDLADELVTARGEFLAALAALPPERRDAGRLVGEWSLRELVAHLGYWTGHAVELIHAVEEGRADEAGVGEPSVDERNETVARIARQTDAATVRRREAASAQALLDRLARLDPSLLASRLPDGASLEEGVQEDSAAHYREHTAELRAAAGSP